LLLLRGIHVLASFKLKAGQSHKFIPGMDNSEWLFVIFADNWFFQVALVTNYYTPEAGSIKPTAAVDSLASYLHALPVPHSRGPVAVNVWQLIF